MKKKLALLMSAVILAAMVASCGGSTPASSTQDAQAEAEALQEAEDAAGDAAKEAEDAAGEAAKEAEDAAGEAEKVAEDASGEAAQVAEDAAAEGATIAAAAGLGKIDTSKPASFMGEGSTLPGNLVPLENQALEVIDETGGVNASGISQLDSSVVEYTAFLVDKSAGQYDEYYIVYDDIVSGVMKEFRDELHFYKSTGITADDLKSIDLSNIYPGFYDMSFADAYLMDCDDFYSLVVQFRDMDVPANMDVLQEKGIFTIENYSYGVLLDAESLNDYLRKAGAQELTQSEVDDLWLHYQ